MEEVGVVETPGLLLGRVLEEIVSSPLRPDHRDHVKGPRLDSHVPPLLFVGCK